MTKVLSAADAAALIPDGATIAATGSGLAGWPEEIVRALAKRFQETGTPKSLTLLHSSAIGDWKERGTTVIGIEGLVKRLIASHVGGSANMARLITAGKIEAYNISQGVVLDLIRAHAKGQKGVLTKVGLGTFMDPRLEGGRMNSATKENIVKVVEFEGEEYLWFKTIPIDVAFIRGTTVDEDGNLSMEKESIITEAVTLAQAARNNGGIVIVQAEYLAKSGTIHPKQVIVPGIFVDHVVIATDQECQWQTEGVYFNPGFTGDVTVPLGSIPEIPLDERKIIVRRSAMELQPKAIVNLGVGVPTAIASIAVEEGCADMMTLTTEHGAIGGTPAPLPHFGHSYNPQAILRNDDMMAFYDGGGIDLTFLGLAQVDKHGNVNVSKFNGRAMGCGGFINIARTAKKVVFAGSFTAGGLKTTVSNGELVILQEGKTRKFVDQVEQVTFSGAYASKAKQPLLYVTERCVFTIENEQMTLIEIAPGVDLERDILAHMDFKPRISPQLKQMEKGIFQSQWGELRKCIEGHPKTTTAGA
ncbi:MAG: CoA-transferase [Candidatus Korobacteraceae bacterium]